MLIVMLGHRLRRWANIIPPKTLYALNHKYQGLNQGKKRVGHRKIKRAQTFKIIGERRMREESFANKKTNTLFLYI